MEHARDNKQINLLYVKWKILWGKTRHDKINSVWQGSSSVETEAAGLSVLLKEVVRDML